jgi:NADH-quinone oxidoreductase subunit H
MNIIDIIFQHGLSIFGPILWNLIWTMLKIVIIVAPLLLCVAYLTLWERKLIGWMQVRIGPNQVGFAGLLQPIADALKLLLKEIVVPLKANKILYVLSPVMVIMPALAAWAVIPFANGVSVAHVNTGMLYIMSITSVGIYGVILAGWASNSKYALLGAMRASAQMVSYELAMGMALAGVLIISNSFDLSVIVLGQQKGLFAKYGINFLSWNWLPLLPLFLIYFISGIAETNRHPFDVVEGESEIVAGHMVEYSGMSFAIFFLAEYANMILISTLTSIMFLGGWSAPFGFLSFVPGFIWLALKVFFILSMFIWIRASFPRYRYDQIMRLGWKIFIPLSLIWIIVVSAWRISPFSIWH